VTALRPERLSPFTDILIAEDEAVSRQLLEATLRRWGYRVAVTRDGEAAWQALQQDSAPSLAILDWMMPGLDGLEVCRRVRQRASAGAVIDPGPVGPSAIRPLNTTEVAGVPLVLAHRPYTYVLILTARDHPEDLVAGLEAGADDYLVKPINPHELRARLKTGQRILQLERRLLAAQAALHEKATRDPLTGLWNRASILEILERELARIRREGTSLSVLLTDLDHFKRINDTLGHLAGDEVLRQAARRMRLALRTSDWIGRYGGEEFLIIQPGCDAGQGRQGAERLCQLMAGEPVLLPGGIVSLTVSVGVVAASSLQDATVERLLREADDALYQAKAEGRNRVVQAQPEDGVLVGCGQG
jgi:two-component system cell cycle response regulator